MANELDIYCREPSSFLESLDKILGDLKKNKEIHLERATKELTFWLGQNRNGKNVCDMLSSTNSFQQMVNTTISTLETALELLERNQEALENDVSPRL
jgi:hypothetical protein